MHFCLQSIESSDPPQSPEMCIPEFCMISELELGNTLLLQAAIGSCLIHILLSVWLAFASIAIKNLVYALGGQELLCFYKWNLS